MKMEKMMIYKDTTGGKGKSRDSKKICAELEVAKG